MRAKIAYGAILLAFLLIAAIVQWPASAVQGWAERAGGGRWRIGGAEGTLWDGGATLLVAEGGESMSAGGRWRAVQNVRWKLRARELLHGRLAYDTTLEHGSVLLAVGGGGMALESLDAQVPAAVLAGMIPGAVGRYGWSGVLQARASSFSCSKQGQDCRGQMEIFWKDAGVAQIPGPQLGSYLIRVVGEGPAIHFDLTTLEGRLQISGKGEFGAGGLRFNGEAGATGPNAAQLDAQLRTLGRPAGTAGRYVIEYRDAVAR
jgi:general secretion pathway protein N